MRIGIEFGIEIEIGTGIGVEIMIKIASSAIIERLRFPYQNGHRVCLDTKVVFVGALVVEQVVLWD